VRHDTHRRQALPPAAGAPGGHDGARALDVVVEAEQLVAQAVQDGEREIGLEVCAGTQTSGTKLIDASLRMARSGSRHERPFLMAQKTGLHHRPLHRSWSSKHTPEALECRVQRAAGRRDAHPQTARGSSATCRARPCRTPRPRRRTPPGSTAPSCCPAMAQHHLIIHAWAWPCRKHALPYIAWVYTSLTGDKRIIFVRVPYLPPYKHTCSAM